MRSRLLTVTLSVAALVTISCGSSGTKKTPKKKTSTISQVSYVATGVGGALVTYGNSSTGISQETVTLPWSTFQTAKPTDGVTLRVHTNTVGPVQCKLIVNGSVRVANQAQGQDSVASCTTHG
jgi:Flp pilus assembly protein TadG